MPNRKQLFMVLDCETATVPQTIGANLTPKQKTIVGTTKPIIYDLGYLITDRTGYIYKKVSYIIADCFYDMRLFETAYYADKRPIYEEAIANGSIKVKTWAEARKELFADMKICDFVSAYNAGFDFKKAIPFTSYYFANRNRKWFSKKMTDFITEIAETGKTAAKNPDYTNPEFVIDSGHSVPIVDIMPLAVHRLCGKRYLKFAYDNELITDSGKWFKTSAEAIYRYISGNPDFDEAHTAIEDAKIEAEMLIKALKKGKPKFEIGSFCGRDLMTVAEYERTVLHLESTT